MEWAEFVIIANKILKRKFINRDDGLSYDFDDTTYKPQTIYRTKDILRKKLLWLFPDLDWMKNEELFDNKAISASEEKLFVFLLENFPTSKIVNETPKTINSSYWASREIWEKFPIEERRKLLKLIHALDDKTYCRYMRVSSREEADEKFKLLKALVLFPQYYRLMENFIHVEELLFKDEEIFTNDNKKNSIIIFEKKFNELLRELKKLTDGYICPYPRTNSEIDLYTSEFTCSDEDYDNQVDKALKS